MKHHEFCFRWWNASASKGTPEQFFFWQCKLHLWENRLDIILLGEHNTIGLNWCHCKIWQGLCMYISCFIILVRNNLLQSVRKSYNHMSLLSITLGIKEKYMFAPRAKSSDKIIFIGLGNEWTFLSSSFQRWWVGTVVRDSISAWVFEKVQEKKPHLKSYKKQVKAITINYWHFSYIIKWFSWIFFWIIPFIDFWVLFSLPCKNYLFHIALRTWL